MLVLVLLLLLLSKCSTMVNHKQSAEKLKVLANLQHPTGHPHWKFSVSHDKMVGVHSLIAQYNVSASELVHQMSRLIGSKLIPVVFICFNKVPKYLRHTIEMASRLNPVILISDQFSEPAISSPFDGSEYRSPMPVFYVPLTYRKISNIKALDLLYQPIHLDHDLPLRQEFERLCLMRWVILANMVATFHLPHVFYADNDVLVAGNLTTAFAARREAQRCDVVVSALGDQKTNKENWIGQFSGHSSFWTRDSLDDFRDFLQSMYLSHKDTLNVTGQVVSTANGHNRVTDQTLLFLYYVAHHRGSAMWDAGRPQSYGTGRLRRTDNQMQDLWNRYDFRFKLARDSFSLPFVSNPSLTVCNGLDVVDRACFDHLHAFRSSSFSLNANVSAHDLLRNYHHRKEPPQSIAFQDRLLSTRDPLIRFLPHITGLTSFYGGRAESFDKETVKSLGASSLFFYSLHYEGPSKNWLIIDVCRRLVSRTQFYMEEYYTSRTGHQELRELSELGEQQLEITLLSRLLDPLVRDDCREVLKNKDMLPPYSDLLLD